MKTRFNFSAKQGSALLIVLGFLSFMMISAVSFAIYMRIERQASSNYRHTITARHMLNAGLYKAMEEIDLDLREGSVNPCKFPTNWVGRVRVSAVENEDDNDQEPRVLSMEALSFVPGILVNDVRRYAVRQSANGDDEWMGAKWRPLDLPVASMGDEGGTTMATGEGEAVVGRYAYVCVNVSDMLNANYCKGATRDTESNRVSITHLFSSKTTPTSDAGALSKGKTFDSKYTGSDYHYDTLQDFYACMSARRSDSTENTVNDPGNNTPFGSPYHTILGLTQSQGVMSYNNANRQVLVADGIVKPEPVRPSAINIADAAYRNNISGAADAFSKQLGGLFAGDSANNTEHFYYMLTDYLDDDNKPYSGGGGINGIYRPTAEMIPMVYQIILPNASAFPPSVTAQTQGTGAGSTMKYTLHLAPDNAMVSVIIECIFPFKNWNTRTGKIGSYKLDASAFLVAITEAANALGTRDDKLKDLGATNAKAVQLQTQSITGNPLPSDENTLVSTCLANFTVPANAVDMFQKDISSGTVSSWFNGFQGSSGAGTTVRIALVVFVGITQGGEFVDLVPGYWSPNAAPVNWLTLATSNPLATGSGIPDRLFFETSSFAVNASMSTTLAPAPAYEWTSLETPDARFNHKASNWIAGSKTASEETVSPVTQALLGTDGRDNDIYGFVSNQKQLYSPGEFGFLLRPVDDENAFADDVTLKNTIGQSASVTEDYAYMFRTVRLYDHGDPAADPDNRRHDPIYSYFYTQNTDGTVSGGRVNPLSDVPVVLQAAIHNTPFDYYWARQTDQDNYRFNDSWDSSSWTTLIGSWATSVRNAQQEVNKSWTNRLANVYGNWDTFMWYSQNKNPKEIFGTTIGKELDEIDRKMLYSFSLDSFSDRQQLFLYIIRAEATAPTLGSGAEVGARSLAGGRAVALVWRDPYPVNYAIDADGRESYTQVKCSSDGTYLSRESPWIQYYQEDGRYNLGKRTYDLHDTRILYFKQLDN